MAYLEFKKNKDGYEINTFEKKGSKSYYQNIIDRDPKKIAQILLDLYFDGFKIEEAIKIFLRRLRTKDWLGL